MLLRPLNECPKELLTQALSRVFFPQKHFLLADTSMAFARNSLTSPCPSTIC
jgi:hypothetical protein